MADRTTTVARRWAQADPIWVKWCLIGISVLVVFLLIVIPVVCVFVLAFAEGPWAYIRFLTTDPATVAAIRLTLTVVPCALVANVVFGIAAAWAISRFRFPGRTLLVTLIDLPFSISPIVVGLMFVLLFGLRGPIGPWLREWNIQILFATPGLILATTFVTIPFIARELIPLMEAMGADEEIAARSLGASGWQILWHVTLPNIKWGLLYGIVLCNARAMGEFGAAAVVSGHIEGGTETMPLRVERLFQDYQSTASFALASVLTLLALATLIIKVWIEHHSKQTLKESQSASGV